jgi:2-oxoisovalerate dehydrogenase E2 component (dihydrolipoyl transacylase)
VLASPAVRQRARDLGIDLADVRPAEDGRIRHADLDAFLSYGASKGYAAAGQAMRDETIKVIGLRKRIAENMAASKRAIPHFTYVEEIDATELEKLRADLNDNRGSKPKLTLLPLFIAALCKALPQYPMLNARYDDQKGVVTRSGAVHLGMATQTDSGLMVPVIRDAQGKNLWQLAGEIVRLADAARGGKAKSEELSGSTITVTSLGPLGGIVSTYRRAANVCTRWNGRRTDRKAQADERLDQLRSSGSGWARCGQLRSGLEETAGNACIAARRLVGGRTSPGTAEPKIGLARASELRVGSAG